VLLGRGLCDELITRPEEFYRLCCIVVCNLESSRVRRPWPALGCRAAKKILKKHDFRAKNYRTYKMCIFISSQDLSKIFLVLRRTPRDTVLNVRRTSCTSKVTVNLVIS
jgi:hypothetical protein